MQSTANGASTTPTVTRTQRFSGSGVAVLRSYTEADKIHSSFTHLSSTFPLKLITPRISSKDASLRIARQGRSLAKGVEKAIAALYIVGYGGGLVSGDSVKIDFDVGERCALLLLTQGSTKVFKIRGSKTLERKDSATAVTNQTFRCIVRSNATLIVLPEPVTCFANSQYQQKQHFDLIDRQTSSLILLDWFTPGRQYLTSKNGQAVSNEQWAFEMYQSRNDIRFGKEVLARDNALLQRDSPNAIAEKCGVYTCFATLFLIGIDVRTIIENIEADFYHIQQGSKQQSNHRVNSASDPFIWSCSRLVFNAVEHEPNLRHCPSGIVVRLAGVSTEIVRTWLRDKLVLVKQLIGDDLYRQALGTQCNRQKHPPQQAI